MKTNKLLVSLASLLSVCLTSCSGSGVHHEASDYFLEVSYKSDFKVLQLTDIHVGIKDDLERHFSFMDLTIKEAEPDMIMVTGDLFTFADLSTMHSLFNFLDSYEIPWGVTFGNHDEQLYFSISTMTSSLNNDYKNCVFKDLQDDDVFGSANYVINLKDGATTKYQFYVMDTNRYQYGMKFSYDYIHQDQIDWYERMVKYSNEINGEVVPSIAFMHIPVPEYADAYALYEQGSSEVTYNYGKNNESVSCPKYNSGYFSKVVELGSTKGIFVGHDHVNNSDITYKGVHLVYGVHSTDRVYGQDDMMGGLSITIHDDRTFGIQRYYHTYEEVK